MNTLRKAGWLENQDCYPFVKVSDPSVLIPVLEGRFPKSAVILNCLKIYQRLVGKHPVAFYTLYGDIDESSWIIYFYYREGRGDDILISADEEKSKISRDEAVSIFSTSKLFNWDHTFFLTGVERWISSIIFEISAYIKGNATSVNPCYLFYKDKEECLALNLKSLEGVGVKQLDPENGTKFIQDTWKYAGRSSEKDVRMSIEAHESAGVYVNNVPVCGVITRGFGTLSALYTLEEHRQKGFGSLAMKYAFKEQAQNGMTPASTVELKNTQSIIFHEKLGCKIACVVDYVTYVNKGF